MELGSDNIAENEKYSFLLGSALRNEETDQFISVYDRIIPKDLTDSQIHSIKEKARWIAELPEEEFNCLVARARNFSLAPSTMSVSMQSDSKFIKYHSEEEDEGLGTAKFKSSDTSSLYSSHTEKASLQSSESDVRRYDEDSGVCNSSKATNSMDSMSDQDASESEERGCYNYFPPQVKIHSGGGLHLDYDEAHEVQSDRSSQDVISPRSDVEIEMTEMTTNRSGGNCDEDFYTDYESDDDQNIHQSSCSTRSYRRDNIPMHRESKEEYAEFFSPNFERSRDTWGSSAHSGLRSQVDEKVSFSSVLDGNKYSRYSNPYPKSEVHTSSDKVKIEKNIYPNPTSKPIFGNGPDQLEKVGLSIVPLLDHISNAPAPNMPEARKLTLLTSEDNKKKKKKKKMPKDELAEKDSLSGPHDENGNPLEPSKLNRSVYRQMRDPPPLGLRGANPSSKSTYGTPHGCPQSFNNFDAFQPNNHQIKNLEGLEDSSSSSKLLKKRKQKKLNKEKVQKSEDIDNYKGNTSDIDELVNFIAGNDVGNRKNKKFLPSTVAATATTDIPGKGEKNNKKIKDKKQKSPIPFSATEEEKKIIFVKGCISGPETSELEVHSVVAENKDSLEKEMGNSSAKTECKLTENHRGGTITVYDEKKLASLLSDSEEIEKQNIGSNKSLVISSSVIDLQCPENNIISSKKGKQAQYNLSPTANNATGEVNKNQEDKRRTARVVGKADKTDKIESSVNQSVKQKNLKNFKSKPGSSSPFVTSDSLTRPFPSTYQFEDVGIGESNVPFTMNSDIMDSTFIFTDIDDLHPVPQEDEFQVVSKKKKKVKDSNNFVQPKRAFHSPYISPEEKQVYASGGKKSFRKQIPLTSTPIVADTEMTRDLSPSAFPALGKVSSKRRKSLSDGRRNSTGEVPIPSEVSVKHLDDSDIESVKSLPVATGLKTDYSDFPRPLVSYASKAASAKPAGNKTTSQASPTPLSKERKEEVKSQVWKGSPTERRHSVGSKPENKSSGTKEPDSPLRRTWCGSSETVVMEDDKAGKFTSEENDLKLGKVKSSNKVLGGEGSVDNKQIDTHRTVAKDNAFVCVPSNHSLSASSSQSSIGSNDSKPSSVTNLIQTICEKELHKELKPSVQKLKVNNNHKQIIKTITTKTSTTNNKKLKQKSVIFLDKKVTEIPADLDITFGFEPCAEKSDFVQPAKDEPAVYQDSEEIRNNVSSVAVSVEDGCPSAPNVVTQVSQNSSSLITNSSKSGRSVISQSDRSVSSGPKMQTSGIPQTDYKFSHIRGINGVVQPSTQGPSQHSSSSMPHDTSSIDNSSVENSKLLNDQEISSYSDSKNFNSRKGELITVLYGENLCHVKRGSIPDSSNNRPSPCCGHVGFFLESGDVKGNSNIVDAASFLQREWKSVLQQKEKDPASVTVFTG